MRSLEELSDRLVRISRDNTIDVFSSIEWPDSISVEDWHFTPEMISLYGTPYWERLDETARQRLSFFEAVNFFSLNIHGERILIQGLAKRLHRRDTGAISDYLHHFLDEENKHMYYFGRFCRDYAGKIYADRKLALPREYAAGEEEFVFFANVLVFEEIVDVYNRTMARDQRVHALSREINRLHHFEESRHLAFGRRLVADLYARWSPEWSDEVKRRVSDGLIAFMDATWQEYYNPEVYEDAGIVDAFAVRRAVIDHPATRAHRSDTSAVVFRTFNEIGVFGEEKGE